MSLGSQYKRRQGSLDSKGSKSLVKKIVVSYIHLDRAQGQTFEQWDKTKGRLLKWGNIVQHLNQQTLAQVLSSNLIIKYHYLDSNASNMPKKSKWKYPTHLAHVDIIWCKIMVMQLVRVIGFLEDNVFYVVFLDENHEFYPTEPKNT